MNIAELENWMHRRIRLFLANGGQLMRGQFGGDDLACAVTACVPGAGDFPMAAFRSLTGVDIKDQWYIADGWDGIVRAVRAEPNEFRALGCRLAEEYL